MSAEPYQGRRHAAARTGDYRFNQLIPYIGNKRRLLGLIGEAVASTAPRPGALFLDLFTGSGVVSRFAKQQGLTVISNDWEPYCRVINLACIACNRAPPFAELGGYAAALERLNTLPPRVDWVTRHLCPADDERYDVQRERLFYMRKNGLRIDAIRHQIAAWRQAGVIDGPEEACLLAPLLYQACYRSNTSGVFKGFHRGWGGATRTALYRIAADLRLAPAVFCDNGRENRVLCADAAEVARAMRGRSIHLAYLDPPYNQHPYGSNYHVLNSIALWDKPQVSPRITRGNKSAIRTDWRTQRRSPYNHREEAVGAYRRLLDTLDARYVVTSYSTDGTIPLDDLLAANLARGHVWVFLRGYKRYRVSSQRFSEKPMNVEFVLVLDTRRRRRQSLDELRSRIESAERQTLARHPEMRSGVSQGDHGQEKGERHADCQISQHGQDDNPCFAQPAGGSIPSAEVFEMDRHQQQIDLCGKKREHLEQKGYPDERRIDNGAAHEGIYELDCVHAGDEHKGAVKQQPRR